MILLLFSENANGFTTLQTCSPDSRKKLPYFFSRALIVPRRSLKSRPELNPAPGPRRVGRGRLGSVHARQDGNNTCPSPTAVHGSANPRTPVLDASARRFRISKRAREREKWNGQTDANIHGGPRAVAWGRGTVPSSECSLDLP